MGWPKGKARKRQGHLPGLEPVKCPAVEKCARKFLDARDERFELIKTFADAKLNLVAAMKENGLQTYEFDNFSVVLDEQQSVTVKKKKTAKKSEEDANADD